MFYFYNESEFSNFICIFAMPYEVLFDFYCNTKLSDSSDIAKF